MVVTPADPGGGRYGRVPCEEYAPNGEDSPVGEERASSLQDVNRVLPEDERRSMVIQIWIHANEPGSYRV
jgi:hypothetical protein